MTEGPEDLHELVLNFVEEGEAKRKVEKMLESGVDPLDIVEELSDVLNEVGDRCKSGEFFPSELMMAGSIGEEITTLLRPYLEEKALLPRAN